LERTASLASAVAALNSQHLGGRGGLPTLEQVEAFLASFSEKAWDCLSPGPEAREAPR